MNSKDIRNRIYVVMVFIVAISVVAWFYSGRLDAINIQGAFVNFSN